MNLVSLNTSETITTLQLREMINEARASAGEPEIRNNDFLNRVTDELDDLGVYEYFVSPANGQSMRFYALTIEQATLVGMRESKSVRRAVLGLLKKMAVVTPDFSNPAIAARAWAEQYEEKQALQQQLTLAAPAVEFVDKFVHASTGSMGFREVCKLLSVNEATFRKFLESEKVVYKLHKSRMPYANHLDAGRFEVKAGVNEAGHAYNAYRFTTKGVEWVAGEFAKWQLRGGL